MNEIYEFPAEADKCNYCSSQAVKTLRIEKTPEDIIKVNVCEICEEKGREDLENAIIN